MVTLFRHQAPHEHRGTAVFDVIDVAQEDYDVGP